MSMEARKFLLDFFHYLKQFKNQEFKLIISTFKKISKKKLSKASWFGEETGEDI